MRMIIAIIQPSKIDEMMEEINELGIQGVTIQEVKGFARQLGHKELSRGTEYACDFVPKVQLTMLVGDQLVDKIYDLIISTCRSGKIGDGIIWDIPFESYMRIRTGESVGNRDYGKR